MFVLTPDLMTVNARALWSGHNTSHDHPIRFLSMLFLDPVFLPLLVEFPFSFVTLFTATLVCQNLLLDCI